MNLRMIIIIIILTQIATVTAMPPPEAYGVHDCQKAALDYQEEHGGSIIWIQPLKPNGAFDTCQYCAHVINRVGNKYIDYVNGGEFNVSSDIQLVGWEPVVVYDLSKEKPPFAMRWN